MNLWHKALISIVESPPKFGLACSKVMVKQIHSEDSGTEKKLEQTKQTENLSFTTADIER